MADVRWFFDARHVGRGLVDVLPVVIVCGDVAAVGSLGTGAAQWDDEQPRHGGRGTPNKPAISWQPEVCQEFFKNFVRPPILEDCSLKVSTIGAVDHEDMMIYPCRFARSEVHPPM